MCPCAHLSMPLSMSELKHEPSTHILLMAHACVLNADLIDICGGKAAHTALLMGVVNTVGTLPGIIASWSTGQLLTGAGSRTEWSNVWLLAIGVYAIGLGAFLQFAQGHDVLRGHMVAEARARAVQQGAASSAVPSSSASELA